MVKSIYILAAIILLATGCKNSQNLPVEEEDSAHHYEPDTMPKYNYSSFGFDSIVGFDITPKPEVYAIADKDSTVSLHSYNKRRRLSAAESDSLIQIIDDTTTYGGSEMACFEPHMAFGLYKKGKVIAQVTVCFECNYLWAVPHLLAPEHFNYLSIADGDTFHLSHSGFSKKGNERLGNLCSALNFNHCKKIVLDEQH